jgi:hypothetical protein
MVGQIVYHPAQIGSTAAPSAVQPVPPSEQKTPSAQGSTAQASAAQDGAASDASNVSVAKTRILQLQARLRTIAVSEADPKSASAQISRLAQEIDATAREYAAEGGDMPIAGVPAQNSPLVAQSLAQSEPGGEAAKTGMAVDIKV